MPTVYERVSELRLTIPKEHKVELGRLVAIEYFKLSPVNRPFLYKKESVEEDGVYQVWTYPKRFIEAMDRVIKTYCETHGLVPKKRTRIKAQKVVYSPNKR